MILKELRVKNCLSYGNSLTKFSLIGNYISVLVGPSGSGKSSLSDFICYALFGESFRDIKKTQLVNDINNTDCLIEVDFSNRGAEFTVRRGQKPNIFEIYKNGTLIDQMASVKDYQDFLETHILGMNKRTFCQIIIMGSANYTPFMKLKATERRLLIEDLLDLNIFTVMTEALKAKVADNKDKTTEAEQNKKSLERQIDIAKRYEEKSKEEIDRQTDEIASKINLNNGLILEATDKLNVAQAEYDSLKGSVGTDTNNKIVKVSSKLAELKSKIKRFEDEITFLRSRDVCPTCEQAIEAGFKASKIQTYTDESSKLIAQADDLIQLQISLKAKVKEEEEQTRKVSALNVERMKHKQTIQYLEDTNENLKKESIKIRCTKKDDVADVNLLLNQLKDNIQLLNQHLTQKQLYDFAQLILKDKDGVKSKILKQYIPIINKYINKFLAEMNFNINFALDENLQETIIVRGRDVRSYSSLSEGERQRLDIAILLTWRYIAILKNSVNCNLLFIDELLDSSLDPAATENMLELLKNEKSLYNNNIFVITHKSNMSDKFGKVIRFEKVKGFSKIIYEG